MIHSEHPFPHRAVAWRQRSTQLLGQREVVREQLMLRSDAVVRHGFQWHVPRDVVRAGCITRRTSRGSQAPSAPMNALILTHHPELTYK